MVPNGSGMPKITDFLTNPLIEMQMVVQKSDEVHVLFDSPGIWGFNLKKKVQDERDAKRKKFQNCWLRKFWALLSFLALHHSGLVFLQIERIKEN